METAGSITYFLLLTPSSAGSWSAQFKGICTIIPFDYKLYST